MYIYIYSVTIFSTFFLDLSPPFPQQQQTASSFLVFPAVEIVLSVTKVSIVASVHVVKQPNGVSCQSEKAGVIKCYPFWGHQTMQMYSHFDGFDLLKWEGDWNKTSNSRTCLGR